VRYLLLFLDNQETKRRMLEWFVDGIGLPADSVQVVDVPAGDPLPELGGVSGVVLTGAAPMVTDKLPWSERTARWLQPVVQTGVPVLGVCYGHQLLAYALGGAVADNPKGRELGTVQVELLNTAASDRLLGGMDSPLLLQTSHLQSVVRLPDGAVHLARNAHEEHHAFRFGSHAWGVQFHPEFPPEMVAWIAEKRGEQYAGEGLDVDAIVRGLRPTPAGAIILRRFGQVMTDASKGHG
jgi:GMP synthase (glutamine-hydrolysing)